MDDYIPQKYLDAIEGFSVEDFDGMEDLTVTATKAIDEDSFRLDYYFDVGALIWTVKIDGVGVAVACDTRSTFLLCG